MEQQFPALIDVLERYADGLYRCDTALLRTVFHPDAQYFTASNGELLHLDMDQYFPVVDARVSPQSRGEAYEFQIDSMEFAGPVTAFARMRCSMLSSDYIDLLTLIRLDGDWKIISKVFHVEAKG